MNNKKNVRQDQKNSVLNKLKRRNSLSLTHPSVFSLPAESEQNTLTFSLQFYTS